MRKLQQVADVMPIVVALVVWGIVVAAIWAQPQPTLQQWLLARGYNRTEWVRGDRPGGGSRAYGQWHPDTCQEVTAPTPTPAPAPTSTAPPPPPCTFWSRYGVSDADRAIFAGYSGDTAGAHGDLVLRAQVAMDKLGIVHSGPAPWNPSASLDAFDLSMVSGATKALIAAAGMDNPQPVPTATPRPTPQPTPTPTPTPEPTPQPTPCAQTTPCPTCPACPSYSPVTTPAECQQVIDKLVAPGIPRIVGRERRRKLEMCLEVLGQSLYVPSTRSTGGTAERVEVP